MDTNTEVVRRGVAAAIRETNKLPQAAEIQARGDDPGVVFCSAVIYAYNSELGWELGAPDPKAIGSAVKILDERSAQIASAQPEDEEAFVDETIEAIIRAYLMAANAPEPEDEAPTQGPSAQRIDF